jgi:manganese-dependent ADP-ribose/CDP-alcohol diphosphatase
MFARNPSCIFVLAVAAILALSVPAEDAATFTFGAIADCQYCDQDTGGVREYRLSPEKLQSAVKDLNTRDLEFTVHLGDFIDKGWESFDVVGPIYKQLTMPSYHVLGNHDFSVADDKKADVHRRLGMPARYYDFMVHGWRFIALDGNDVSLHAYPAGSPEHAAAELYYADNKITSPQWNGAIGAEQMSWLRGVLDEVTARGESAILMAHFPVYPENVHNLWNAAEVLSLIDEYPCVKAYLNGHNHAGNYGERKGVHYVTFKGMVDTKENSYATVAVTPEELRIAGFGREENRVLAIRKDSVLDPTPKLMSLVPPLDTDIHKSTPDRDVSLPIADAPFSEHVRQDALIASISVPAPELAAPVASIPAPITTVAVEQGGRTWIGTEDGLYSSDGGDGFTRHPSYGVDGPLSNRIMGLAVDARGTLWAATPAGLSSRDAAGTWNVIRGRQGLPWEALTAISIAGEDLWIGSTRGLILYRPYAEGRQWFYRAGQRYLPDDHVTRVVALGSGGELPAPAVYVETASGATVISEEPRTLHGKAEHLLGELLSRKMRLGMTSPPRYDDPYSQANPVWEPQPSDGLWNSYHITSMSLAYALTGEERYKAAAKASMESMYLLQNVTGIKGLVARTVVAADDPYVEKARTQENWHETADKKYWWRDDVSSDQLDGHYFAFYTYYEHIAKHDPAEKERLIAQIRQVTDYILDHGYQVPDWDGEKTLWGWFDPISLNEEHIHYLESGIYSLMMLSFLKTTHYITGDEKYQAHYVDLIQNHGYLSNLLLQKKLWPDEMNHSDDQLSAICFYPFLQIEHDPVLRDAVHRSLRRHALIERDERNSLMAMVYASVDPGDAEVEGAIQTLREMPLDRRTWGQFNSHRADVIFDTRPSVRGRDILLETVPADERQFERWNQDPYQADTPGDGRLDGAGVHYMLAYWLGRYHGVISAPAE